MSPDRRRALTFIAVGCVAAAVHFGVVAMLVQAATVPPLAANPLGWLVALCVSFAGHRQLTFAEQRAPLWRSARRFALVSALGFGVNEAAYALLLRFSGLGWAVALAAVLLGVAVATYVASRHWAFLSSPAR